MAGEYNLQVAPWRLAWFFPGHAAHFCPVWTPSRRRRVKFSEVAIGERFYDPISAEYFVKQSEGLAAMVTGIGDGTIPDEFEADDVVGIDLH